MNLRLSGFVAVSAVLHLALLTLVLSIQPDSAVADTASVTLHVVEAAPYLSAIPRPDSAEVSKAVSEPKPKPEPEPIPVYKSVPTLAPKPMPAPRPETKPLPVQQADTVSEAGSSIKTPDAEKPVESSGIGSASESSFKPASDLINPAPKTPIQPAYPAAARKNGIEGSVLLELTVDEHGNVEAAEVKKSSGSRLLDKSALSAAKKTRFTPGTKGGIPVRTQVTVNVRFELKK